MAYIGVQPAEAYTSFAVQHFTTSATTSYTLDHSVANENEIALFINNVRQQPGSSYAYTASGTTLTLSAATSASDTMYCVFIGKAVQTVTVPAGSLIDLNGQSDKLVLDEDGDTTISADTDDQIDFKVGGSDVMTLGPSNLTVDVSGNIRLDADDSGEIRLLDGGTQYAALKNDSSRLKIQGIIQDQDVLIVGNDGGVETTAVAIDMSEGGRSRFYGGVSLGGDGAANTLDDYEEGTWSPVYTATGGSITATTTAHASYVKVGNMVYIQCKVATYQSSLTGDLSITGLPFTASNVSNKHNAFAVYRYYYWNTDMPNITAGCDPNTSAIRLFKNATNATSRSRVQGSDTAGGVNQSNIVISGCYQVD